MRLTKYFGLSQGYFLRYQEDYELRITKRKIADEINKIQEHLRDLKEIGKVKVEGDVYAGVKIYIRDVLDEVKIDTKSVTFFYDKAFSKRGPYEPPSLAEEQPDGYSAD